MDTEYFTLGHFPPEDAWGVYDEETCPDLGGNFIEKERYCQYPERAQLYELLLTVRQTFVKLDIKPRPGFIYPTLEEVMTWTSGGQISWKKKI